MVAQWAALPHHSSRLSVSTRACLDFLCMFSPCLCGFAPPKTMPVSGLALLNCPYVWISVCTVPCNEPASNPGFKATSWPVFQGFRSGSTSEWSWIFFGRGGFYSALSNLYWDGCLVMPQGGMLEQLKCLRFSSWAHVTVCAVLYVLLYLCGFPIGSLISSSQNHKSRSRLMNESNASIMLKAPLAENMPY